MIFMVFLKENSGVYQYFINKLNNDIYMMMIMKFQLLDILNIMKLLKNIKIVIKMKLNIKIGIKILL